ncbi:NAD-dependent malic enzyme, partial [Paenibacillus sp. OT2-17]|uniref:NAD(P)-dependent malic enzyme n=1 Tax=Paenibacillus sp. OT2-17 TaxID=2691605 RepID=UPI0013534775
PDEFVRTVEVIAPGFGGIHLEDIKAPECFYIEDKLKEKLNIPVYHDDQHGTAVAVLAGLFNALKLVGKKMEDVRILINGAGASGIATAKLLLVAGAKRMVLCDINGALVEGDTSLNEPQQQIAKLTNRDKETGSLAEVIKGKDIFIGLSVADVMTKEMVQTMSNESIIFALANPIPEILPEEAHKGGARIVATGRSDFHNQINNLLAFPGIFRGAFDAKATDITMEMKLAAARSIAELVTDEELDDTYIVPDSIDKRVSAAVSKAVKIVAEQSGVVRK